MNCQLTCCECSRLLVQPFPGDLSVGEVIAGFENVTDQPKLPISEASSKSSSHWQALLDKDGIIGPDGKTISVKSVVDGSSDSNRATVVFDSGDSACFRNRCNGAKYLILQASHCLRSRSKWYHFP